MRGVDCPSSYPLCGRFEEDSGHLFWRCKLVRRQWFASQFADIWQVNLPFSSLDILCDFKAKLDVVKFAEVNVFLWAIWNLRNQAIWSSPPADRQLELGRFASDYVRRFLEASMGNRHSLGPVAQSVSPSARSRRVLL